MRSIILSLLFVPLYAALAGAQGDFSLSGISKDSFSSSEVSAVPAPSAQRVELSGDQKLAETRKYLASLRSGRDDDNAARLAKDTELAIKGYEYCFPGKPVSFADNQDFTSGKFYMDTGSSRLNPNTAQTRKTEQALDALMPSKPSQPQIIFEALIATDGNVPRAIGSLAELFCVKRGAYVPNIRDMAAASNKNYYRFAGMFIGLHSALIRTAGWSAAYANIVGNPIVYAGAEIGEWWYDFFKKGKVGSKVDTLRTLGPDGNGNLVDKIPELHKGLDAAEALRKARNLKL